MNIQSKVGRSFKKLLTPGWISLAIFVGYCTWFMIYNYPCDGVIVTLPLILAFAFLTSILLLIQNPFVNIGLGFGAIGGALYLTSSVFSYTGPYQLIDLYQLDEELSIHIAVDLMMGMIIGAIIGSAIGLLALLIHKILNSKPYLQKAWTVFMFVALLATIPWFYSVSWGTFGYRWVINDLVRKQGDELFEALVEYDDQFEYAYDSMYVYSYIEDKVELLIATRDKLNPEERFWIVVYELELEDDIWRVSEVYGRCGYDCMGCYQKSYTFQN